MGYDQRMIIDHTLQFDLSREDEFLAAVAAEDPDDEAPETIYEALRRYSFETDREEDGTFSTFEIDWMSGDSWSEAVFDALAPYVREGDFIHHRHIAEYDSDVTDTLVVFDGAGSWQEKIGHVVFD